MGSTEARRHGPYSRPHARRVGGKVLAALTLAWSAGAALAGPRGELDPAFGANGVIRLGAGIYAAAIAQQPSDGKLILAGGYPRPDGWQDIVVIRLSLDGSLDGTFGRDGIATIDFPRTGNRASALALQPDGRIIVAGWAYQYDVPNSPFDTIFARLNPDGTLDQSFGSGGRVTLHLPSIGGASQILPLTDGQLLFTATTQNKDDDIAILRLQANGELDATFGTGPVPGMAVVDSGMWDAPGALIRQSDGKYVVCGTRYNGWDPPWQMLAIRLNPDGSLDGTFGTGGLWYLQDDTAGAYNEADDCVSMPDGSLVLAGERGGATVVRLRPDGVLDTTHWNHGFSTIDTGDYASLHSIVLLDDGWLGVAGQANVRHLRRPSGHTDSANDVLIARIDPETGLLDTDFGDDGKTLVDFGSEDLAAGPLVAGLIQQADGKLVVAGSLGFVDPTDISYSSDFTSDDYNRLTAIVLARVDPHGTGDTGFVGFAEAFTTVAERAGEIVATVRRTGGSSGSLLVDFDTVPMTATAPADFTATRGTLVWSSGDMAPKQITVPIVDDHSGETTERFQIVLSSTSAALASSRATVWVTDDESVPVSPAPTSAPSAGGSGGADGGDHGGGGAVGIELLGLLAGVLFGPLRSRRRF
jgi:uncharacterized delta-60 repeat protein